MTSPGVTRQARAAEYQPSEDLLISTSPAIRSLSTSAPLYRFQRGPPHIITPKRKERGIKGFFDRLEEEARLKSSFAVEPNFFFFFFFGPRFR